MEIKNLKSIKVALVNPPIDFNLALGKIKKIASSTKMIPLGIAYVAASVKQAGYPVEIIDSYAEDLSINETIDRLIASKANVIGFSVVTPTVPIVLEIAKQIRERHKNKDLIMVGGGAHCNIMPDNILESKLIDIVVRREGEETFVDVLKTIQNKADLSLVKGISYCENNQFIHNPDREFVQDLETLPYPAYDLLKMHLYSAPPHWLVAEPAYQMITSRGCPFQCTFCGIKALGKSMRYRGVENVVDEIELLIKKYSAKEIMFVDTTFPLSRENGVEFCREILKRGLEKKIKWVTETRVDVINLELLLLMKQAGCRVIGLGLETGSPRTLKRIKKGTTLDQAREAVQNCKSAGIDVYASFIIGIPGEKIDDIKQTIEFIKTLPLDFPKVNLLVPYPGSEIYEEVVQKHPEIKKEWEKFTSFGSMTKNEPIYVPDGISSEEITKLHKAAYKAIYLRPGFLFNHLKKMNSWINIKKYLQIIQPLFQGIFS